MVPELACRRGLPPPWDGETGLGWYERDELQNWIQTFEWKYDVVGTLDYADRCDGAAVDE